MPESVRVVQKFRDQTRQKLNRVNAYSGNAQSVLEAPGRPGYIYYKVPQANGSMAIGFAQGSVKTADAPIVVAQDPWTRQYKVEGSDSAGSAYTNSGNPTPGNQDLTTHHVTHELGGSDQLTLSSVQVYPLNCIKLPTNTFQHVTIYGGVFAMGGLIVSATTAINYDLSSYAPLTGVKYIWVTRDSVGAVTIIDNNVTSLAALTWPATSNYVIACVMMRAGIDIQCSSVNDIVDVRAFNTAISGLPAGVRGDILRHEASAWAAYSAKTLGFIVQGDGIDTKSAAFNWDVFGAGAGADMVHDHTNNAEGGTLNAILPQNILIAYNYKTDASTYRIGIVLATSERGLGTLVEPTLGPGAGWEAGHVKDACLVVDDKGVIWLFYSGWNGSNAYAIGVARSYDGGTTWTKYGSNPILSASQAWENVTWNSVSFPQVIYDRLETDASKRWKMWYIGGQYGRGGIGYAYSADGLSWTKYASNPVLAPTGTGDWEGYYLETGPAVRRGNTFYLFYGGSPITVSWKSGVATFTDPEGTYTKSAHNPILSNDLITSALGGNVGIGDTSIAVADATIFPIGACVGVYNASNQYLSFVTEQIDSTHIRLRDAAPVAVTLGGGHVRSIAYNSVIIQSATYDGGWRFWLSPFNGGFLGYVELSGIGYAPDDLSKIYIDYSAGVLLPFTLAESQGANLTRENPSVLYLWRDYDRYLKSPPTSTSGTVTSISQGTGIALTPNPITATGTVAMTNTAVTPGPYTNANLTVDQQGRITAASSGSSGSDHLHGLARWLAGGGATFDLPDTAEYLEWATINGLLNDQLTISLASGNTQLVFDVAPTAGDVVQAEYVVARI